MGTRVRTPAPGLRRIPTSFAGPAGAAAAGLVTLLTAPWVGMAWELIAPAPTYLNVDGTITLAQADTSEFIAADGWFLLLTVLVGLGCGALGYWRFRRQIPPMLTIAVAGLIGAFLARATGIAFGPPELLAASIGTGEGDQLKAAIDVRADAALLGWPLGVLLAYVALIVGLEKPPPSAGPDGTQGAGSVEADRSAGEVDAGYGGQAGQDEPLTGQQSQLRA